MDFSKFVEDNGLFIRDARLMRGPILVSPDHPDKTHRSDFVCRLGRRGSSLTVNGDAIIFHPEKEEPTLEDVTIDEVLEIYFNLVLDVEGLAPEFFTLSGCVEEWGDEVKGREVFFRAMREANDFYHFLGNDLYVEFIEAGFEALDKEVKEEKRRKAEEVPYADA